MCSKVALCKLKEHMQPEKWRSVDRKITGRNQVNRMISPKIENDELADLILLWRRQKRHTMMARGWLLLPGLVPTACYQWAP